MNLAGSVFIPMLDLCRVLSACKFVPLAMGQVGSLVLPNGGLPLRLSQVLPHGRVGAACQLWIFQEELGIWKLKWNPRISEY